MEKVLLLNSTYEPIRVIHWKKAVILLTLGKVEVLEEYSHEIRSISVIIKLPSVIRLLYRVHHRYNPLKFNRRNLFARDRFRCQYCGKVKDPRDLTFDHVIPKSKGGVTDWTNIVTCCILCNNKKGGRLPEEANMTLIRIPRKPFWLPTVLLSSGIKDAPGTWQDYLYIKIKQRAGGI